MPGGNASHKSTAIKPNTNMNGAIEETDGSGNAVRNADTLKYFLGIK